MTGPAGGGAVVAGDWASNAASRSAFISGKAHDRRESAQKQKSQEFRRQSPGLLASRVPVTGAPGLLVVGLLLGRRGGLDRLRRLQLEVVLCKGRADRGRLCERRVRVR